MTAYIHIGTPKTGTTSIQKFLYKNREALKAIDYYYPIALSENHWELPISLGVLHYSKNSSNVYVKLAKERLEELRNEIYKNKYSNYIFSSELFYEYSNDKNIIIELKAYFKELGFSKIIIIVYIRDIVSFILSFYIEELKSDRKFHYLMFEDEKRNKFYKKDLINYKKILSSYIKIFGKENLIVKIFDKKYFFKKDLIKDFCNSLQIQWNNNFQTPKVENSQIDLLGINLIRELNFYLPRYKNNGLWNSDRDGLKELIQKHFCTKDENLKFFPSKKIVQAYIDRFEELNKWLRKEFFLSRESVFSKIDLVNYKENYELKEMKPEYWNRIAKFITDIVRIKNKNITDKINIIQNKDKLILTQTVQINSLQVILKEKDQIIISKSAQLNQIQSKLSFQTKYGIAKTRIQNQLSYKLGQAMIVNSKSILGYIRMPFVLSYIKDKHKQEQKIYQEKIKKDPSLKLPSLEDYPDYKEALKEKECLTYKLGQALIKANKTWYGGGYIKLLFEIRKLKREFRNKI